MNDRLSLSQIAMLVAYACGMAGGQILFKLAALRGVSDAPLAERMLGMLSNGFFVAAVLLYARPRRALGLDLEFHAAVARLSVRGACLRIDAAARQP